MVIVRRFVLGILVALLCVGAWDYGKHFYALKLLKEQEGMHLENARITMYRKGFRIHATQVNYHTLSARDVRVRVPFFSISQAIVWARTLNIAHYFMSKKTKFFVTFDAKTCRVTHFYMKNNALSILPQPITNHHISGHADISPKNITYTLHATMLSSAGHDLSTLTSFGGIAHPYDGRRKGELRFKLSNVHPIFDLLTQYNTIKGWQKDLLMRAFDKDVVIPIDIRGTYLYMGPIKLAEIA